MNTSLSDASDTPPPPPIPTPEKVEPIVTPPPLEPEQTPIIVRDDGGLENADGDATAGDEGIDDGEEDDSEGK